MGAQPNTDMGRLDRVESEQTIEVTREEFTELISHIEKLSSDVENLKSKHSDLKDENRKLRETVLTQREQIENVRESIADVSDNLAEHKETFNVFESRLDALSDTTDIIESDLEKKTESLHNDVETIQRRLEACESELNLVETDIADKSLPHEGLPKVEKYSQMPDDIRQTIKSDKPTLFRAVLIWESWDDWSVRTLGGERIESGDIKTYLNSRSDTSISYQQVYRAMEKFDEVTPDNYYYKDEQSKLLIRDV